MPLITCFIWVDVVNKSVFCTFNWQLFS